MSFFSASWNILSPFELKTTLHGLWHQVDTRGHFLFWRKSFLYLTVIRPLLSYFHSYLPHTVGKLPPSHSWKAPSLTSWNHVGKQLSNGWKILKNTNAKFTCNWCCTFHLQLEKGNLEFPFVTTRIKIRFMLSLSWLKSSYTYDMIHMIHTYICIWFMLNLHSEPQT